MNRSTLRPRLEPVAPQYTSTTEVHLPSASLFLRPYVASMSKYTAAPLEFHQAAAYAVVGALLSRETHKCVLAEGEPKLWTNLYIVLLAGTGQYKGTVIMMATAILDKVDSTLKAPDDMSFEGFLKFFERQSSAGIGATTILIQEEWVNLLMMLNKSYSAQMRPQLNAFYNVPPTFSRSLKNAPFFHINQPKMSMLGGITPEFLAKYSESEDWESGFYNRCMFITGKSTRKQKEQPRVPVKVQEDLAMQLARGLERWKIAREKAEWAFYDFTPDANKARVNIDIGEGRPELCELLKRSKNHLAKIAAIEQFDEDPEAPAIGKGAVQRARDFVERWQASVPETIALAYAHSRSDFEGDRLSRSIMRLLKRSGGRATLADVLKGCGLDGKRVRDAIFSLQDAGAIVPEAVMTEDSDVATTYYKLVE